MTVTGFEQVQTGLESVVGVRDLGLGLATLDVELSISEVTGFVGDLSQVNTQAFTTQTAVQTSGVYLLGSLSRGSTLQGLSGAFLSVARDEAEQRVVCVRARTYRIDPVSRLP